jgi:hypothetical protein
MGFIDENSRKSSEKLSTYARMCMSRRSVALATRWSMAFLAATARIDRARRTCSARSEEIEALMRTHSIALRRIDSARLVRAWSRSPRARERRRRAEHAEHAARAAPYLQ